MMADGEFHELRERRGNRQYSRNNAGQGLPSINRSFRFVVCT
ncbi:hypothetical protein IC582_023507 [Cucumis melo]